MPSPEVFTMRVGEAIERAREKGFDWKITVLGGNEYFSLVYRGAVMVAYPIEDGEVMTESFPDPPERFERIVGELCDEPLYYEDDWWLVAACGDVDVSLMFREGDFGEVMVRGVGKPLDGRVVERLIDLRLDGVNYVYRFNGKLHVEFVDWGWIRVSVGDGGVGLFGLSGDDVGRIKGVYDGLRRLKEIVPAAGVVYSEDRYVISLRGSSIEVPPDVDYVLERAGEYSRDGVLVIPGSFEEGTPGEFFVVGPKYVCVVRGKENLERYWRLREILGDLGGVISDETVEIVSDSFGLVENYVEFSDFDVLRRVSELVPLPEGVRKYL